MCLYVLRNMLPYIISYAMNHPSMHPLLLCIQALPLLLHMQAFLWLLFHGPKEIMLSDSITSLHPSLSMIALPWTYKNDAILKGRQWQRTVNKHQLCFFCECFLGFYLLNSNSIWLNQCNWWEISWLWHYIRQQYNICSNQIHFSSFLEKTKVRLHLPQ